MRRPSDSATADQILDAAEPLFAGQGFAATTIKQIGAAAGVNPALLYYYFGSKEKLYHEMLARLFGTIAAEVGGRLVGAESPEQAVAAVVEGQGVVMSARPSLPRLLVRELVDHEAAHTGELIAQLSTTVFERLRDLIRAGQSAGLFRADVDPRFAAISVVSLIPYFHVARPAVTRFLGCGPDGPAGDEVRAYGRHAAEFALAALRAAPAPPPVATEREKGR